MTATPVANRPSVGASLRPISVPGLSMWGGTVYEEEQKQLKGLRKRLTILREMKRDTTIGTAVAAVIAPLLSADFDVTPGGASPADQEAAEFVKSCLDDMNATWRSHVEEALECVPFGFSLGEMVFKRREGPQGKVRSDHDDGLVGLASITPIGQETIADAPTPWTTERDGTVTAVQQRDPVTGQINTVPGWKLLHFALQARKRNPEGESLLLDVWRDWRYRHNFEEIEGIGAERDVGGMPVVYPPREPTSAESTELKNQFGAMKQDEQAVVIMPGPKATPSEPGWLLEPYGGGGAARYNIREIIRDYDSRILMRFFAQFLRYGQQGETGNRALTQGAQDFLSLALRRVQQTMLEEWNGQMVPLLLELNSDAFAGLTALPKVTWNDPGVPDLDALMKVYEGGERTRILTITQADEDHLRAVADLPDLPEGVTPELVREKPEPALFPGGGVPPGAPGAEGEPGQPEGEEADDQEGQFRRDFVDTPARPAGQKLRVQPGKLERATNGYQKELVSAYDRWSARAVRAVANAQRDGLGVEQQAAVLNAMLADLEEDLVQIARARLVEEGLTSLRGPYARWQNHPQVLSAIGEQVRTNEQFIRTSLLPDIAQRARADILQGVAADTQALRASFERLRYRPAQYAGGMYVTTFEAGRAAGELEDGQREAMGMQPIAVRWELDPRAEHCEDGAGTFGCPGLAQVYEGGYRTLPTVPGGLTSCRSGCRCILAYLDPDANEWRRVA